MLEEKTEFGNIRFSTNVIKKIVTDAVHLTEGNVYIYHYRGKYQNAARDITAKRTLYNGDKGDPGSILVADTDTGLKIAVWIVVKFGTSIKTTCVDIIDYIFENVEKVMGEKPEIVKVIVTGVESNEIAKRNLEYSKEARLPGVLNEPS